MVSDTSRNAYEKVFPKITRSQKEVLDVIRAHPEGLTNAEMGHYLGRDINRVTPRRNELVKMGLLVDLGVRVCRKTQAHAFKTKEIVLPPAFEKSPEPAKESKTNQQQLFE